MRVTCPKCRCRHDLPDRTLVGRAAAVLARRSRLHPTEAQREASRRNGRKASERAKKAATVLLIGAFAGWAYLWLSAAMRPPFDGPHEDDYLVRMDMGIWPAECAAPGE